VEEGQVDGEALIREYLGRLEAAAWPLEPGRRSELQAEVADHIEAALAEAGARDEVTVRNVLDRLGRPEEIVAADAEPGSTQAGSGPMIVAAPARSPWGVVEILAILFLTIGAFLLPVLGPLVGVVFTSGSSQWSTRAKVGVTILVVVIGLGIPILGLVAFTTAAGAAGGLQ
jgi:thiol:disulfide interchange protein